MVVDVMLPGASVVIGAGRGAPPVPAPAVKTSVPVWPALSLQGPPSVARLSAVCTCTGVPSGVVTIVNPSVIVPFGLGTAVPTTLARVGAPHWSS